MNGITEGMIGNTIFTMIQKSLCNVNISIDSDLEERLSVAIEKASEDFYKKYGTQFGDEKSSFIVRQKNIDSIVKSLYYSDQSNLVQSLSGEGFDDAIEASEESVEYFVKKLEDYILSDYRLNKIMIEKRHIEKDEEFHKRIIEVLDHLDSREDTEEDQQSRKWIMSNAFGEESDVVEGKSYHFSYPNGLKGTIMYKNNMIYLESIDLKGRTGYFELDLDGNVKNTKLPYELSEYEIIIPDEHIISKQVIPLQGGFIREVYKMKWDRSADIIFASDRKLSKINLHGVWAISQDEKLIKISGSF